MCLCMVQAKEPSALIEKSRGVSPVYVWLPVFHKINVGSGAGKPLVEVNPSTYAKLRYSCISGPKRANADTVNRQTDLKVLIRKE